MKELPAYTLTNPVSARTESIQKYELTNNENNKHL
jgi:hypothetical protein